MNEVIGYVLAVVGIAAFGYFIYTKFQANKARKLSKSSGSGGGSGAGRKLK